MSAPRKYSLVQWVSGDDKGKWTTLDSSCIRGFEFIQFDSAGLVTSDLGKSGVVVEWRCGPKPKSGAWSVYEAKLIRSSCKCRSIILFTREVTKNVINVIDTTFL